MKPPENFPPKCAKRTRAGILARNTRVLRPRKPAAPSEPTQPFIAPILGNAVPCN